MAKRTETRAAAAAKKGSKSRVAARAARPGAAMPKMPAKTASSAKSATAKDDAKAKPTKATATKTAAAKAPLGQVSASKGSTSKASASKAARKPIGPGKTRAEADAKSANAKPAPAKAPARVSALARKAKAKATSKVTSEAKATKPKTTKLKAPSKPRFLAAELGHPVDHEGEPIGAGSRAALADTELQRYTLQLWRQMQSRRGVNTHIPAMERAGVTIDQIWTAGVTDRLTTSSSPDDVKRYRQKLLFRANLLESILTETVDELQRLGTIDPTPPRAAAEPG